MSYELHLGDCLEIMPNIPSASIDAIICDLPYGTTACKWDSIIPLDKLWPEYKRIIKSNGAIVLFGSQPFTSQLIMTNLEWFKYEIIWRKNRATGHVHAKNKPLKAHENILIFSPGTTVHKSQSARRMTYNPKLINGKPYKKKITSSNVGKLNHAPTKSNIDFVGTVNINTGNRYPTSVMTYSLHNVGLLHPTQKPVELLEYLIKTYTNPGDTVLDNTMGSGTTGHACMNTGRNFIGIEKDAGYFATAKRRIENAQPALLEEA